MVCKNITKVKNIQIKRALDFNGSFQESLIAVRKMTPPLKSGEPMIVSFLANPTDRTYSYYLAIGRMLRTANGAKSSPIITPMFSNVDDIWKVYDAHFQKYLNKTLNIIDLEDYNLTNPDAKMHILEDLFIVQDEYGRIAIASEEGLLSSKVDENGNLVDITTKNLAVGMIGLDKVLDPEGLKVAKNQDQLNRIILANLEALTNRAEWHTIQ